MVEVAEALTDPATRKTAETNQEPMRVRMLNEFVYCPRLFYYEQVEGVFVENADTARGSAIHEKVDRGKGALLRAKKKQNAESEEQSVDSPATDAPNLGEPGCDRDIVENTKSAAPVGKRVVRPAGQICPDTFARCPAHCLHSRAHRVTGPL